LVKVAFLQMHNKMDHILNENAMFSS
jgi:hypothetical protein